MVTGSVASIVYGEPRMTHDVDLVLHLRPGDVRPLLNAYDPQDFYCPPEENLRQEAARSRHGHFNIIHHETGFKADIYLMENSPLQVWAMARRQRLELTASAHLWLAPPEYVITQKLLYFREGGSDKHVRDIRGMLALSDERIDRDALLEWIAELGLGAQWKQVPGAGR